jgi:hypothetical protein
MLFHPAPTQASHLPVVNSTMQTWGMEILSKFLKMRKPFCLVGVNECLCLSSPLPLSLSKAIEHSTQVFKADRLPEQWPPVKPGVQRAMVFQP